MREFNNYGEMSSLDFRDMQMIELKAMLYFDEFCKKYGLRYYISGGTLIGAYRNHGFVPWDEDMDVHMPRPDYNKLPGLWKKYADTNKYSLCMTTFECNTRQHAYMVCDNDTTLIEERTINDDIPQGIKFDIMPYDGSPSGFIRPKVQLFWAVIFSIYNVQRLPENQGGKMMRLGVKLALGLIRSPQKRYKIWKYAEKKMSKYDFETSPWVRELIAPLKSMLIKYPRKDFTNALYVDFEGYKLPAQHYSEDYLTKVYHNYMELPPVEKRTQKVKAVYINLDKSYKSFKGTKYCIGKENI